MTTKFLLSTLGTLLCSIIFAQTSTFEKGVVQFKNGENLSGYINLVDKSNIAFKLTKETDFQKYFIADEVVNFSTDSKNYKTIEYNNMVFFASELEQGNINLYEESFSKNDDERYFIETDKKIIKLSKSNYYDVLKKHIGDLSLFKQYDEGMFVLAFDFSQDDLVYLINYYNQQFIPIIQQTQPFAADSRNKGNVTYKRKTTEIKSLSEIPNSARNVLVLKTEVLYNQISEALKEEDWKKINVALNLLKPLGEEVESFDNNQLYQQLLESAKEKNSIEFKKTFIAFVSTGLYSLIDIANQQNKLSTRKFIIRQAFVEFLEIRDALHKTDPKMTERIINQFKMIFAKAKMNDQFKIETKKMVDFFNSIVSKIISN